MLYTSIHIPSTLHGCRLTKLTLKVAAFRAVRENWSGNLWLCRRARAQILQGVLTRSGVHHSGMRLAQEYIGTIFRTDEVGWVVVEGSGTRQTEIRCSRRWSRMSWRRAHFSSLSSTCECFRYMGEIEFQANPDHVLGHHRCQQVETWRKGRESIGNDRHDTSSAIDRAISIDATRLKRQTDSQIVVRIVLSIRVGSFFAGRNDSSVL